MRDVPVFERTKVLSIAESALKAYPCQGRWPLVCIPHTSKARFLWLTLLYLVQNYEPPFPKSVQENLTFVFRSSALSHAFQALNLSPAKSGLKKSNFVSVRRISSICNRIDWVSNDSSESGVSPLSIEEKLKSHQEFNLWTRS